jgi:hypothetical protein
MSVREWDGKWDWRGPSSTKSLPVGGDYENFSPDRLWRALPRQVGDDGDALIRIRVPAVYSEFAIAQIVEIAIRALSPAVNDTFTGVACVDWLADALLVLANGPS